MKTEEKINSLFETLRAEKASTTVSEVSTWIGVASAATAVGTSLPFLLKLKGLFISKLGIMTLTTLATSLSVVGVMYFSSSTALNETSTKETKKQDRLIVQVEKQDEQKKETKQAVFPVKKEEKTNSIFPQKEEFFPFKEEDFPQLEKRKSLPTTTFAIKTEGSFSKINARGGFEIEVVKGSGSSYEVLGSEEDINSVKISISNNTIFISPAKKNCYNVNPTIRLTMSELNGIDLSGACTVKSDDTFTGTNFDLQTSGASEIKIGISVKKLTANISGASEIDFFGDASDVEIECSGASELDWGKF